MSEDQRPNDPLPYRSRADDLQERGHPGFFIAGLIFGFIVTCFVAILPAGLVGASSSRIVAAVMAIAVFGIAITLLLYVSRHHRAMRWSAMGMVIGCCICFMLQGICFTGISISG